MEETRLNRFVFLSCACASVFFLVRDVCIVCVFVHVYSKIAVSPALSFPICQGETTMREAIKLHTLCLYIRSLYIYMVE